MALNCRIHEATLVSLLWTVVFMNRPWWVFFELSYSRSDPGESSLFWFLWRYPRELFLHTMNCEAYMMFWNRLPSFHPTLVLLWASFWSSHTWFWQLHPQHRSANIPIIFPPYISKPPQSCLLCFFSKPSHLWNLYMSSGNLSDEINSNLQSAQLRFWPAQSLCSVLPSTDYTMHDTALPPSLGIAFNL